MSPVPATPLVANIDKIPSSICNAETANNTAKRKEVSVWDSLKDDMLRVSFESSAPSTNLCIVVALVFCVKNTQKCFIPKTGMSEVIYNLHR